MSTFENRVILDRFLFLLLYYIKILRGNWYDGMILLQFKTKLTGQLLLVHGARTTQGVCAHTLHSSLSLKKEGIDHLQHLHHPPPPPSTPPDSIDSQVYQTQKSSSSPALHLQSYNPPHHHPPPHCFGGHGRRHSRHLVAWRPTPSHVINDIVIDDGDGGGKTTSDVGRGEDNVVDGLVSDMNMSGDG